MLSVGVKGVSGVVGGERGLKELEADGNKVKKSLAMQKPPWGVSHPPQRRSLTQKQEVCAVTSCSVHS